MPKPPIKEILSLLLVLVLIKGLGTLLHTMIWGTKPRNTYLNYILEKYSAIARVSKTVTKQLIAEGIIGKLIGKKPWRKGYAPLYVVQSPDRVYVTIWPQRSDEPTEEAVWTPSFVDAEVWERAVSKFHDYMDLDKNVEKYLFGN